MLSKMRLALALLLAGCATQVPAELVQVNREVNQRATCSNYAKWDFRVLRAGDKGNCAAFAFTKYVELRRRGIPATVEQCMLPDGQSHAYTKGGEWALDNRHQWPVPVSSVCK